MRSANHQFTAAITDQQQTFGPRKLFGVLRRMETSASNPHPDPLSVPQAENPRISTDSMTGALMCSRHFRTYTVIDGSSARCRESGLALPRGQSGFPRLTTSVWIQGYPPRKLLNDGPDLDFRSCSGLGRRASPEMSCHENDQTTPMSNAQHRQLASAMSSPHSTQPTQIDCYIPAVLLLPRPSQAKRG